MSGHATIEDVFNPAYRLGGEVFGDLTDEDRKKADAFLNTVPGWLENEIFYYNSNNPFNYKGNPDDPAELEKYTQKYLLDQRNNIRQKLAERFGSNAGIKYYNRAMKQIGDQFVERERGNVIRKRVEVHNGNIQNRFQTTARVNIDTKPAELAWSEFGHLIDWVKSEMPVPPEWEQKVRADYGRQLYEKAANDLLGGTADVNDLQDMMGELKRIFSFMPNDVIKTFDNEGNLTGTEERPWSYEGKSEWEQKQLEAHTRRIQEKRFGYFQERQAYVDRCIVAGNLDEAIEKSNEWGAQLNLHFNPNRPEYANLNKDLRDRASGFFNAGKLEGYKKQGEMGVKTAPIKYYWRQFLSPAIDGSGVNINGQWKTFASLEEAIDDYIYTTRTAFFYGEGLDENGYDSDGVRDEWAWQKWRGQESREMEDFYNVLEDVLKDKDPNLLSTFHRFRNNTIFTKKESPYFSKVMKDLSDTERTAQAQRYISYFNNMLFRESITDVATIEERMKKLIDVDMTRLLFDKPTKSEPGAQLMQEAEISIILMSERADELLFVDYDPEKNSLMGDGRKPGLIWLDPKDEEIAERQRQTEFKRVSDMLGIAMHSFGPPQWMPSSRHKGDVIPKGMFTITSRFSSEQGTFYLDYDDKANPIVMKQNASGGWDVYMKEERPLTESEKTQLHIRTMSDYKKAIRNGKNPITGEDFDYSVPPPGSNITKAQWNDQSYIGKYRVQKDVLWADYFIQEQGTR